MTTTTPVPAWKFWHPMPFWQALAIYVVVDVVLSVFVGGLGLPWPGAIVGGVGSLTAFLIVVARARALARKAQPNGS